MNAKKSRTTRKQRAERMDALTAETDGHLAELRAMPRTRRFDARRRYVQGRVADLGLQMRTLAYRG